MKPQILVAGAPFSNAGYGRHARVVLKALKSIKDQIDVSLLTYRFSNTSNTAEDSDVEWFNECAARFDPNRSGFWDVSLQIGVPNEWKNLLKLISE